MRDNSLQCTLVLTNTMSLVHTLHICMDVSVTYVKGFLLFIYIPVAMKALFWIKNSISTHFPLVPLKLNCMTVVWGQATIAVSMSFVLLLYLFIYLVYYVWPSIICTMHEVISTQSESKFNCKDWNKCSYAYLCKAQMNVRAHPHSWVFITV